MEVEHAAKRLVRHAIKPSQDFGGLEEPPLPLPHSAKADMALRPCGSQDDLWLPLQIKSTSGPKTDRYHSWFFEGVAGYPGMLVACVALQRHRLLVPENKPRAWVFPGTSLNHFSRGFTITLGHRHDTENTRCSFARNEAEGMHIGDALLSAYRAALVREEGLPFGDTVVLQPFASLRNQVSRTHQTELETLSWFQPLFDAAGIETVDAPCPSLPYDVLARKKSCKVSKPLKLQMKTAYWMVWGSWGPLAHVNIYRKHGVRKVVPYRDDGFDLLLVGPPRNRSRLLSLHEKKGVAGEYLTELEKRGLLDPQFFYMFSSRDLHKLGLVSSGGEVGKKGFSIDFSKRPNICSDRLARGPRVLERLSFRYSMTASSLATAAQHFSAVAKMYERSEPDTKRGFSTVVLKREGMELTKRNRSAAENMEVEHAAKRFIRREMQPSGHFPGMEEPESPLHPKAKADMAFRPCRSQKDLWLPLQVKSTEGSSTKKSSRFWSFHNVSGYADKLVVCISLECRGFGPEAGAVGRSHDIPESGCAPRAWVRAGSSLVHLQLLKITEGGMHDTANFRCFFHQNPQDHLHARSLRDVVLSAYNEAASAGGTSEDGITLRPFQYLQNEVSSTCNTEIETLARMRPFFDAAGLDPFDAECPTLPYDILAMVPSGALQHAHLARFQMKTACWAHWNGHGPLAWVNTYRDLSGLKRKPYE
eukprot:Cvel_23207.t1-p1 / transcript=Cvel_23207.t1 / gene=Cvel_23207 / organism=Chromera_velia_CCMP2878 / gene_product=hypothetical protein / transcript_product=hypothetical protein / location=Cvel_scaffold2366:1278-3383(-) / protein_length=702 / sequence_SO=supercontig / SO=protein_coding / is_pseudo=false